MSDTATTLSPEEAEAFRIRCREFLAEQAKQGPVRDIDDCRKFTIAAAEAGLGVSIQFPTEYGGAGLTAAHDKIWREEKSNFGARDTEFIISHGMCLPMLNEHGSHEQKAQFMADNIAGRTVWCQMFSEPGAGSDVASLQTKAERDGDEWIVNGQKVWTTLAHKADYGIVIARTDPDQPKHAGISMFILDMKAPGVEIRPIHQIDGGSHFNEVFFTDVRIPASWQVGELNNGWRLATSMLMYERVAIGSGSSGKMSHPNFDLLVNHAKANGVIDNPVVRDQLMQIYCMEAAKSLVALRTKAEQKAGKTPGPGGSLGKLFGSMIAWRFRAIAQDISGMGSVAWEGEGTKGEMLNKIVLNSFQSGIAGGTDEIQRNIIGDRVLGLPREPMVDKDMPFRDLKVGTQR